jgi:galactose mutarotase-like enzyme
VSELRGGQRELRPSARPGDSTTYRMMDTLKCESIELDLPGWPRAQLVRLSDEEHGIRAMIHPAAGAEISSLEIKVGDQWQELLYGALDYRNSEPDGWGGRAPTLWPSVGRSYTKPQIAQWEKTGIRPSSNQVSFGTSVFEVGEHGFVRDLNWEWKTDTSSKCCSVICAVASSESTKARYPFDFKLVVTYTLTGGSLLLQYEVIAGGNDTPMPFSIGNHIAFRLPFSSTGSFDSCMIRTPGRQILCQDELCLLSGETLQIDLSMNVQFADRKFCDLIIGGYQRAETWFELIDPSSLAVRLSHTEVTDGKTYRAQETDSLFVLWGDPVLGYFCPEPWLGKPNSLNTKSGCVLLPPAERFVWQVQVSPQIDFTVDHR